MKYSGDSLDNFELALAERGEQKFVLRLYVSGATPRSTQAITKIKEICEEYLPGQYDLQIIDIYQHPEVAKEQQILAVPLLVKEAPGRLRKMIGNLTNTGVILRRLGIVN